MSTGNGGNNWREKTAHNLGELRGEFNAILRLLNDPETGLSAINRKITETRHEITRMKLTQFFAGGALVAAGALAGGSGAELGKRIVELASAALKGVFG